MIKVVLFDLEWIEKDGIHLTQLSALRVDENWDILGNLATVIVEDGIGSGAYGTNELTSEVKAAKTVRAMGLLHIDEFGTTVLRVRNCDEVAYIPPVADRSNPKTGDLFLRLLHRK